MPNNTQTDTLTLEIARTIIAGVSPSMLYAGKFPRNTAKAIFYTLKYDIDNYSPDMIQAMQYGIIRSRVRRRCNKGIGYVTQRYTSKLIPKELHPECHSYDYQEDIANGIYAKIGDMHQFSYRAIDNMIVELDREYFNKGTKYWTVRYFQYIPDNYGWTSITWKQYRKLYNECPTRDDIRESKIIVRNLSDTAESPESRMIPNIPDYSDSKIHNILARLLAKGFTISEIANRTGRNWRTIMKYAKELREASKLRDKYTSTIEDDILNSGQSHPDRSWKVN